MPPLGLSGPGLGVEAHDQALHAAALDALTRNASGGVELDQFARRHDVVHGVQHRGFARAVVAQQEQVPAVLQVDGLVLDVVEVDQTDASDNVLVLENLGHTFSSTDGRVAFGGSLSGCFGLGGGFRLVRNRLLLGVLLFQRQTLDGLLTEALEDALAQSAPRCSGNSAGWAS